MKQVSQWLEHMPPAVADAVSDRRAPEYRDHLRVSARLVDAGRHPRPRAVIEVVNDGPDMISLLSVRTTLVDPNGDLVDEQSAYIATPLAIEDEWRGPLMPGATRRVALSFHRAIPGPFLPEGDGPAEAAAEGQVEVEVTELRVWQQPARHEVPAAERPLSSPVESPSESSQPAETQPVEETGG
jgi:hypothetical protein